ncbi:MAG TPA: stage V sporulation protein AA [Bacillota bacterium]|nr:stage V sporulation protein AA [Bacillota bacterium]
MVHTVYLRLKKTVEVSNLRTLLLKDIAFIGMENEAAKKTLEDIPVYRLTKRDKNLVVLDSFLIIETLTKLMNNLDIQLIGPAQTVIRVMPKSRKKPLIAVIFIWILLFIGTSMTIMNFHYDVSMQEVQQKLHYLLTGKTNPYPLWIQIPYSIGLGIGTLLFFNHWFNKRFNEEPSPLEVEVFNYQQDLDNYLYHHENKLNDRNDSP